MNDNQLRLLQELLYAVANDPVSTADLKNRNRAHKQLSQLLAEHRAGQLSLSPRDLFPAN